MKLIAIALIAFMLGTSVPEGYQCKPPDFERIKQVQEFTQNHLYAFTQSYPKVFKAKVINVYLPDNQDTALVVIEVTALGIRQAMVVAVLTYTDQWIISGFTVRDEGIFKYLNFK